MNYEKYMFSESTKKTIFITLVTGFFLAVLGVVFMNMGGHHGEHGAEITDTGHEAFHWSKRVYANLWINNLFFTGLAAVGIFFITIQYVVQAGWSVGFKRIAMAMASWLPIAGLLMVILFVLTNHDIFHWTHKSPNTPNTVVCWVCLVICVSSGKCHDLSIQTK